MPLARTHSVALVGVTGHLVEVEVDIANGLVGMILVGLPDTALREARDRIHAAIVNSREEWPQRKITVGLSPATLPKRGSWFDLAIAIGILAAAGKVPQAATAGVMFFGELGLDGRVRPVRGVLPAVAAAAQQGFGTVMVATQNAEEACLVPGVRVIAAATLTEAADWLRGAPGPDGGPAAAEYDSDSERSNHHRPNGAATAALPIPRRPAGYGADPRSRRPAGPVHGAAGRRGVRRGRPSPVPARTARGGQDDARRADPDHLAQAGRRRGARGHVGPLGGREPAAAGLPAE